MGNKRVFVVSNVATINTKTSSDLLGVGEIGVYGQDAATLRTVKATNANVLESITIALGRSGNLPSLRSFTIDLPVGKRKLLWRKSVYAAPVLSQTQVATDCTGISDYDNFLLRVSTRFAGDEAGTEINVKTYGATGKFVDATTLYAKLATLINADLDADFTATSSGAGVVIIPKTPRTLVDVGFEYVDGQWKQNCMTCTTCNSTVTKLNEPSDGEGTYWHLRKHLLESRGHLGTHWTNDRLVPLPEDAWSGISSAGQWDFYFLDVQNVNQAKGEPGLVFDIWQENVIAVPAGTNFAAFTQTIDFQIGQALTTTII